MRRLAGLTLALLACPGCKTDESKANAAIPKASALRSPTPPPTPWLYLETGDLAAIKGHGTLRILAPRQSDENDYLPRDGYPADMEHDEIEEFAKSAGLTPVWVYVANHDELIGMLLAGKGDVIAASMTATPARKAQAAFTVPFEMVREQLVVRQGEKAVAKPADLSGRKVALRRSSSFFDTIEELKKKYPKIGEEIVPESVETEDILDGVATGKYDVAAADGNLVDAVLTWRDDLKVAFDLTGDRPLAWAVRPDAKDLKEALDHYLGEQALDRQHEATYFDDLPGLERRKVLRVLTRNSAATYFLWKGDVLGFDYELVREFAKRHGMRVQVVVPPSREDLLPWLKQGKGDLVAAALTATADRQTEVQFSRPYDFASEELVARPDSIPKSIADLAGRKVWVRKSSSYWQTLSKLIAAGTKIDLQAAPEDLETEEIIAKVASGEYDLTVADSPILDIELTWRTDVTAAFPLGDPVPHGIATRPEQKQLQAALDAFVKDYYRSAPYNIAYRKYFKDPRGIRSHAEFRIEHPGELSPYDEVIRRYAGEAGFDWRLIASQMYQESRFDPAAKSWVGALGLMQVMPRTGKELGYEDLVDPETGIRAGIAYMDWLRDRFEPELSIDDRTWFALASYNAGSGHVTDARTLARQKGLDANKWFGNVETMMLTLSKPAVARKARFGYCRGEEPVGYVREIRDRYESYRKLSPDTDLAHAHEH